jgi:dTDP-L-rhamnose 4-epimerase
MNILITGGAGFIGRHLCTALATHGHRLTVLDNFSPQVHKPGAKLIFAASFDGKVICGDVRDRDVWQEALQQQDAVVHLAAETGTGQSMYEVQRYESVNIAGTALMLDCLINDPKRSVRKLVVASSRAIYGEGRYHCTQHGVVYPTARNESDMKAGQYEPRCTQCDRFVTRETTAEDAPFSPSSFYGLTKQVQEQMVLMYARVLNISGIALRYQNVYGPGQSLNNPYTGILAIFSNLARTDRPVKVFEDGLESRDFVYIDDVVAATMACLRPGVEGQHAVNVGSGVATPVHEVAAAVVQHFASASSITVTGDFRLGDIRHNVADLHKARALLGFEPTTDFRSGLKRFLDWASGQEVGHDTYERSLQELADKGLMVAARSGMPGLGGCGPDTAFRHGAPSMLHSQSDPL